MLPLIAVGFVMMTIGVALLCLGEVPIGGGKRIPALRSRLIGVVLVSFLPLAWAARQATVALLDPDAVEGLVVSWSICGVCWCAALAMLFRVIVPKRGARSKPTLAGAPSKNPFGEASFEGPPTELPMTDAVPPKPAAAVKKPTAKKPGRPALPESDPFDFS